MLPSRTKNKIIKDEENDVTASIFRDRKRSSAWKKEEADEFVPSTGRQYSECIIQMSKVQRCRNYEHRGIPPPSHHHNDERQSKETHFSRRRVSSFFLPGGFVLW